MTIVGGIDLNKLNMQLVEGDFSKPEGYRQHLRGAYAVYMNTDCE